MTRELDAPREAAYRAFVDPDRLAAWFGPVGWSVPRETVDQEIRVGGHQRFTMVSDEDSTRTSPIDATFVELVENELLVGGMHGDGMPGVQDAGVIQLRVEFHDAGDGRTRLVLRQGPYAAQLRDMADGGWASSFTKLDTLLAR
jgi:uncharacterized protein YndB with AHSA1/START domain